MKHTVEEIELSSGAKGLLIHVPNAPVMTFNFSLRAGEYLVDRPKWETPHIMEHLLLGANKRIPKARTFQAEFEKNGAYCNASTGVYDVTYDAECADFEWNRILDWLMVAITEPLFLEEEFTAEFGNVREELTARSNNHFRHLNLALRESYGFYGLTDHERLSLMDNVKLDDIKAHYNDTHFAENMRFIIAGNLTPARKKQIAAILNGSPLPRRNAARNPLPIEIPEKLQKPLHIVNNTVDNYYFYMDTFASRRMNEAELDAVSLLNSMLTETLYSRILGTARERGLVYSMSSGIGYSVKSTNWWFGAQVRPDNVHELFDIMITQLQNVFEGKIDKKDIEAAKQYRLGRYQRGAQTVGSLADWYSGKYFFEDIIDDFYAIPGRIEAVNKDKVIAAAKDLFRDDLWGFGVLGYPNKSDVKNLHQQLSVLW